MQLTMVGEEVQLAGGERFLQIVEEQSPEQARQDSDGQEEAEPATDPSAAVRRDPTAGDKTMQVGMVRQVLSPGVQHAQEADFGAEMDGIGGDGAKRLGRGAKQDIVDRRLVLEGDDGDLVGHRENDVEVLGVEQFCLAVRQPSGAGERLALWDSSCCARNGNFPLAALWANSVMGSQRRFSPF